MPEALQLDPIAVFEHDYGGQTTLRSYPPIPAEDLHQGEMMAQRAFGSLLSEIKSPAHIYHAAWRDPVPEARTDEWEKQAPKALLFSGGFGIAPYKTSTSLVDTAEMYNRLDRAHLRIDCDRPDSGALKLKSLTLEINDGASQSGRLFRSCWQAGELKGQDLTLHFEEPGTRLDAFRFHVQGRLPRRYNHGAQIEDEFVQFSTSGGAMPLPPWVNY
ncbi:hypothetical protein CD351_03605 [Erythrobacter sp. KY5]|uniref:hypothetical protein n=1 Tax=Erythrobacter sp. KY5 TaxID=2011159 RepID=UPI000DBEF41E|nr:hypothetical protein [Erythrobacter sp. KY5]AWW73512.1 hypothetical protein CD351_03605 [Erythrobacter sp. KY5]